MPLEVRAIGHDMLNEKKLLCIIAQDKAAEEESPQGKGEYKDRERKYSIFYNSVI